MEGGPGSPPKAVATIPGSPLSQPSTATPPPRQLGDSKRRAEGGDFPRQLWVSASISPRARPSLVTVSISSWDLVLLFPWSPGEPNCDGLDVVSPKSSCVG